MMTQTLAMFADAYRELNHKKLFWITLILSAGFIGIFACLGVSDQGISFLGYKLGETGEGSASSMYKWLFTLFGVDFWLTWAATILALISTAFIFPDFLTAGAIDLYLAKPIGRWRLFLTKYMTGLLFVALQVTAFCSVSFFVMGIRGGVWLPGIFLGIPIVTLFFSYLFCIQVFFGVMTRSTIAALLLTMLCWFGFWVIHKAESTVLTIKVYNTASVQEYQVRLKALDERIARLTSTTTTTGPGAANDNMEIDNLKSRRAEFESRITTAEASNKSLDIFHTIFWAVKTVVPKTADTVELLSRSMTSTGDHPFGPRGRGPGGGGEMDDSSMPFGNTEGARAAEAAVRERPIWWVVGTSLLFEAAVVALAGWMFCRRDY